MSKINPKIMGEAWDLITECIHNNEPYKQIEKYYNEEVLKQKRKVTDISYSSNDIYYSALKVAIVSNLIDFSAKHPFDINIRVYFAMKQLTIISSSYL